MKTGWFKFYRKALDNPIVSKDSDHLAIWVWLLTEAYVFPCDRLFGKERITVNPGQLITSAEQIGRELKCSESKVKRVLKAFESDRQIEQRSTRYGRLITILRWDEYQSSERQDERQVTDKWTTSDRQVNATKEYKNNKNSKNEKNIDIYTPEYEEIVGYLNEMCGTSYRASSKKTQSLIRARLNEGYRVDDFKAVIYKKGKQWVNDPKMCKFLRPETLFSNKFEGYLNERESSESISRWEVDF